MRIALVDADSIAYTSAVVCEKNTDWGDGVWTVHADEGIGEKLFRDSINKIQDKTAADKVILVFSDQNSGANFRYGVLPSYKGNRAGHRDPILRRHLVQYGQNLYESVTRPTLEGDDVLGILATRLSKDELIICSMDKDLKTIPGTHYNFSKDIHFTVTEEEADFYHMQQTLTGDTTDGYDGCPGIGPVTAKKALEKALKENPEEDRKIVLWGAVVALYEKAGLSEEVALQQARVARICRVSEYDFRLKKVKLWNPPSL